MSNVSFQSQKMGGHEPKISIVEYFNDLDAIQSVMEQSLRCVIVSLGERFRLDLADAWSS